MNKACLLALTPVAAGALAACDARKPVVEPSEAPGPSLGAQETGAISIIRPDVSPEPAEEAPPEPLDATIPFAGGGTTIDEAAERALAAVLASPQLAQGWPIILRGHTDSTGTDQANLNASRRRADAVAAWLTGHGIESDRIEVIALGEQRPVAPNAHLDGTPDEEGRAANRRVTVTIAPAGQPAADGVPKVDETAP